MKQFTKTIREHPRQSPKKGDGPMGLAVLISGDVSEAGIPPRRTNRRIYDDAAEVDV